MSPVTRLLALCVLGAAACEAAPDPGARYDAGGADRAAGAAPAGGPAPASVVSLVPAVTDWLIALGAADRLVARTDYDRQPELAHLPSVGGGLTPSIEWLASHRPDLVITWADDDSRSTVRRLADLGVTVYAARFDDLAETRRTVRRVAGLLGLEARADSVLAAEAAELERIRRSLEGVPRPAVFWLVSLDPPTAAGGGTFVGELLGHAGARNVFDDLAGWPVVALEEVVRRQPDVIVATHGDREVALLERLRRSPGWRETTAVRSGRVLVVDPDLFHRPGPGIPSTVRRLAGIIHGDAAVGADP